MFAKFMKQMVRGLRHHTVTQPRRVTLHVDGLERRDVPASFNIDIVGHNGNDDVKISEVTRNGTTWVRVYHNGVGMDYNKQTHGQIRFWGNGGDDTFVSTSTLGCYVDGGSGNDRIVTGKGDDLVFGGSGNDTIETNDGNDQLRGESGNDRLWAGNGKDRLYGDAGNDQLYGGAGVDELWGDAGNDRLYGEAGTDFLIGGNGDDYLDGGVDSTVAWGGYGADRFVMIYRIGGTMIAPFSSGIYGVTGIRDMTTIDTKDFFSNS